MSEEDTDPLLLTEMTRVELQQTAMQYGIKANAKSEDIIKAITSIKNGRKPEQSIIVSGGHDTVMSLVKKNYKGIGGIIVALAVIFFIGIMVVPLLSNTRQIEGSDNNINPPIVFINDSFANHSIV